MPDHRWEIIKHPRPLIVVLFAVASMAGWAVVIGAVRLMMWVVTGS